MIMWVLEALNVLSPRPPRPSNKASAEAEGGALTETKDVRPPNRSPTLILAVARHVLLTPAMLAVH